MALERKDLRLYLDAEVHAALLVLADVDRLEPAKLCEAIVEQYVLDRVHAATLIAHAPAVAGLSRLRPVDPGSERQRPVSSGRGRR